SQLPRFTDSSVLVPIFYLNSCLPALHLSFLGQPVSGAAGVPLSPVTVVGLDVFGNVTSATPAVTVTSTPAAVSATVHPSGGLATFTSLVFGNPGTYTLNATAGNVAGVTSNSFTIRIPTTTTLASSLNPARYSRSVTLTASVSPVAAGGNVTFYDGT